MAESVAAQHPDTELSVLVMDDRWGEVDASSQPFRVLHPRDLNLSPGEFEDLAVLCDQEELREGLIPRLLLHLLERSPDPVTFLADSQWVLAPLTGTEAALREGHAVVVPRLRSPLSADGRTPTDADALERGMLTTSLIAVAEGAKEFLSWWAERTAEEAMGEAHPDRWLGAMEHRAVERALNGMPRARWLDIGARYFNAVVLQEAGVCVSFWNLDGRAVAATDDGWTIDGQPLRTFDFEGYAVDKPHILSLAQGTKPRVLLSEHPGLFALCNEYRARLEDHGVRLFRKKRYGYGVLLDDIRVDSRIRRLYREAIRFDVLSRELPPNPFVSGQEEAFVAWLNEPVFGGLSRYLSTIHSERPDLQIVFPDPAEPLLLQWARDHGRREEKIPAKLLPPEESGPQRVERPVDANAPERGVNVIGFLSAQAGLGVSGRALEQVLDRAGVPHGLVSLAHPFADERGSGPNAEALYDINIVCGTPDLMVAVARDLGSEILRDRYNIGLFFWEADQFRPHVARSFRLTNEVWASSWFIADAVKRVFDGPIHIFPHPFAPPRIPTSVTRAELGLPEGFLFLFVFDYSSSFKRKNPLGLVKAFKSAFEPGEGPGLAIKSIVGEHRLSEREQLWFEAVDRPDIILLEGTWPEERKNALMAMADCYVSLHRSEGLGMTMAEAMLLGKPVIATAYSGNVDFMDEYNSFPVRHRMTRVGPDAEPYDPEWFWAEPDVDHAAKLMRWVYQNQEEARNRGARAREDLLWKRSVEQAAAFVRERLEEIRRERELPGRRTQHEPVTEAHEFSGEQHAVRRARELIERGPDRSSPSRYGAFGRLARGIVSYLLRPYDRHQQEVQRAVLDAIRNAKRSAQATSMSTHIPTHTSEGSDRGDQEAFRRRFLSNLKGCGWQPHPLHNVFTQYNRDHYLQRREAFLHKYRCFYAVSKTIAPRRIIELGVSAGSGADAYLSATPEADYLGVDLFPKEVDPEDGSTWDPYVVARKLLTDRGFKRWRLMRADLRSLGWLPATADLVVVDGAHDYESAYSDLRLALTADPRFIFVDDSGDERAAGPAIRDFLETDVKGRLAYTVPIEYVDGGLVIRLLESPSSPAASGSIGERAEAVPGGPAGASSGEAMPGAASREQISGGDGGARRARELIHRGPDPSASSRFGAMGRLVRGIVLFHVRQYDRHQREVQRALLDAIHETERERG
jgi:glycosyltransferase involved in cell wall biosynthesis